MKSLMELIIVIGTITWIGAIMWTGFMVIGKDAAADQPLMDYIASSTTSLLVFGLAVVAVVVASMVRKRLTRDN